MYFSLENHFTPFRCEWVSSSETVKIWHLSLCVMFPLNGTFIFEFPSTPVRDNLAELATQFGYISFFVIVTIIIFQILNIILGIYCF